MISEIFLYLWCIPSPTVTVRKKLVFFLLILLLFFKHLVDPAGVFAGLMSICLSVPAVQVGGYSAQQV